MNDYCASNVLYQRLDFGPETGGVRLYLKQAFLIFIIVPREQGGIQNIQHQQSGHAGREGADFREHFFPGDDVQGDVAQIADAVVSDTGDADHRCFCVLQQLANLEEVFCFTGVGNDQSDPVFVRSGCFDELLLMARGCRDLFVDPAHIEREIIGQMLVRPDSVYVDERRLVQQINNFFVFIFSNERVGFLDRIHEQLGQIGRYFADAVRFFEREIRIYRNQGTVDLLDGSEKLDFEIIVALKTQFLGEPHDG